MSNDALNRSMREIDMERTIREGVEHLGGFCWAVRDSRGFAVTGMPDLIIVAPWCNTVALLELKSQRRKVEDHQRHVLDMLEQCTDVVSGIVRPKPKPGEMDLDTALALIGVETQEATP